MHPEDAVDPPPQQRGDAEERRKAAIAQDDVAGVEPVPELTEQGSLAGLLTQVGADGHVTDRPGGQRDDRHQAGDREAQAGLLHPVLREGGLILGGVGHRDGGAVDELDPTPSEEPPILGGLLQGLPGVPRQPGQDAQREPLACLAVRAGRRRTGRLAACDEQGAQASHGGTAGVVRAKDLAQKGPEGEAGRVDATISPAGPFTGEGFANHRGVEHPGEESSRVVADRFEMASGLGSCSLKQRRPPPTNLGS